jgi:uncharacterized protein
MNLPDPRIIKFLKAHHVMTMATCSDNRPWCSNCYYVYLDQEVGMVITSDLESRHIREALVNTQVAGSIVIESDIPAKIQGIQFEGKLKVIESGLLSKAKLAYMKRFPMTAFQSTNLWFFEVSFIKYTDNRLGPGNKLFWKR